MHKLVRLLKILIILVAPVCVMAQTPRLLTSGEILLGLKKLNVLGSVLFIAAHPDDENTRLLAYFAKEKLYRTGYLSLTRGDGGQNLIGNEQGVELGLIRTQELLSARRIDGAEQFFSRAFDFGFSKSTQEALRIWDKEKILSDVVWVIRKFQPDVIITRFPPDSRAGHGHHSASSVLAQEAYAAAADPSRFPEQLKYVKPWQAKRILWNTFNFGGNNTTSEDQYKMDVGMFNPILGKGYGEIAAESRSQHKSQGFGAARQRGASLEYFSTLKGDAPKNDLLDGVTTTWSRVKGGAMVEQQVDNIITNFSLFAPGKSVKALVALYKSISALEDGYWKTRKLGEVEQLAEACCGLWIEATTREHLAVQHDVLPVNFTLNNQNGNAITIRSIRLEKFDTVLNQSLEPNKNMALNRNIAIETTIPVSQPYWLKDPMRPGSFEVKDQLLIGNADNAPALNARFVVNIEGQDFELSRPVQQKFADPVKGELYEPLVVVPPVLITPEKNLLIAHGPAEQPLQFLVSALKDVNRLKVNVAGSKAWQQLPATTGKDSLRKGSEAGVTVSVKPVGADTQSRNDTLTGSVTEQGETFSAYMRSINYDHIPEINYFRASEVSMLTLNLNTLGKTIGYIEGAGDYVPAALQQMGYEVTMLNDNNLAVYDLSRFDAIITGVRAYDIKESLSANYEKLMNYVAQGGNLIVQYNRLSMVFAKNRVGPYPFGISAARITDENAAVKMLKPDHAIFNFPNKITQKDFAGWVQERSIYHAQSWDSIHYETLIAMHDPGEPDNAGSLITTKYGKGYFTYTGLVFFRQLPAGVPGAYRLLANLIALNKKKGF